MTELGLVIALGRGGPYDSAVATVGENIKRIREEKRLTQVAVAEVIGVKPTQISNWENDRYGIPDTSSLLKLAKALGCTVDDLLAGIDPEYDDTVARAVAHYEHERETFQWLIDGAREQILREKGALPEDFEESSRRLMRLAGKNLRRQLAGKDDVELDYVDVSGFTKHDVPIVAEGDASPQPNLFWDDSGVLLSEVEDRISRPYDVDDPRAYGVRVRGDSMLTRLKPGDIAIVSPNTPVRDGDEVYAQLLSGERLLKVAHKMTAGWLLESYNRAYEPRQVKKSEIGAMHPILWIRSLRRSK